MRANHQLTDGESILHSDTLIAWVRAWPASHHASESAKRASATQQQDFVNQTAYHQATS